MHPDFLDLISAFNAERVEYLVVGAHALAAHGLPRATGDIDLWVNSTSANAARIVKALTVFGMSGLGLTAEDFCVADQVIQLGVEPVRIDILTSISGFSRFSDVHDRRLNVILEGVKLPILSREDLIVSKRAAGRPQDIADVARLTGQAPEKKRTGKGTKGTKGTK